MIRSQALPSNNALERTVKERGFVNPRCTTAQRER
jgi:hypothetical protein